MIGTILHYSNTLVAQNQKTLASLFLFNWMKVRTINKDKNYSLHFISYDGYPFYEFSNSKYSIFIEGKIYNKLIEEIKLSLFKILDSITQSDVKNYNPIRQWIKKVDGDFIISAYEKSSGQIVVFNDFLGRLPTYYYLDKDTIIISRSFKYIVKSTNLNNFNKYSLAQNLLFGYSLGDDTLFSKIKHLKPSSLIHIIPNEKKILVKKLDEFDYSVKENSFRGKKHVEYLADLFSEACKNRTIGNNLDVLSLSGGLDSRIVAGGLFKANVKFISTTLRDPWKVNTKEGNLEVKIAQEVVKVTETTSTIIEGRLARGKEFFSLLNLKDGTNHLGLSYLLRYLQDVQEKYSSKITFYTGDGGDKVVKYQPASSNLKSYSELFDYILKIHKRFSLENVSKLTGIRDSEIKENIIEYLKTYPEKSFNDKYLHFIFNERVNNWLFEGEDRNRHFFWSVTPFYSLDFFVASMTTPDKIKKRNRLYIDLLNVLMPELNNIVYANLKWPVNSLKSKVYLYAKDIYNSLPQEYRRKVKNILGQESIVESKNNQSVELLKEQINSNNHLYKEYLDIDTLGKFSRFSSDELKMLLNLILTMQHLSGKNTILSNYLNTEFSFK